MTIEGDIMNKYACVSINHKKAPVRMIESVFFKDVKKALFELAKLSEAREIVLLQTCNRVEAYTFSEDAKSSSMRIAQAFKNKAKEVDLESYFELYLSEDVAKHLFRVAAGLDSMAIGEQEILGQVNDAFFNALETGTVGPYLKTLFRKALVAGKRARVETEISKGPLSLAHAAVDVADKMTDLREKRILVVGAGKAGRLLSSSLKAHGAKDVTILSRTYEKAAKLAKKYGFCALPFEGLTRCLKDSDIVFVATSAHDYLIGKNDLKEAKEKLIFDLSNPRNVDPNVADLPFIKLKCIDDLKEVTENNKLKRLREVEKVEEIIHEEFLLLKNKLKKLVAEERLKEILIRADEIRRREVERTIRTIERNGYELSVLDTMSKSIVSKILSPVIDVAKRSVVEEDLQTLSLICKILGGERNGF